MLVSIAVLASSLAEPRRFASVWVEVALRISSEGKSDEHGLATMVTSVDIRRVDSAKLMRGKSISAGIIDGNVNIQSKRARTANDLTGRFHLELSQIQSLELPGSESFMQLVKLPTISGPSFDQEDGGTIDGRLTGGLLHVDNLRVVQEWSFGVDGWHLDTGGPSEL